MNYQYFTFLFSTHVLYLKKISILISFLVRLFWFSLFQPQQLYILPQVKEQTEKEIIKYIRFYHSSGIVPGNSLWQIRLWKLHLHVDQKRDTNLTLQMAVFLNYMNNSLEITNWSCLTSNSSFSKINKCSHFSYLIREFYVQMTKCIIYSEPPVLFYNKRPSVL